MIYAVNFIASLITRKPNPLHGYFRFGGSMPPSHQEEHHGSLLSMVGDEFMDANVAANEKEVRAYFSLVNFLQHSLSAVLCKMIDK